MACLRLLMLESISCRRWLGGSWPPPAFWAGGSKYGSGWIETTKRVTGGSSSYIFWCTCLFSSRCLANGGIYASPCFCGCPVLLSLFGHVVFLLLERWMLFCFASKRGKCSYCLPPPRSLQLGLGAPSFLRWKRLRTFYGCV